MAGSRRNFIRMISAITSGAVIAPSVNASTYPTGPIKVVVPFPPGGTVDTLTRPLAQQLSQQLGQQLVVENKGGANGTVGSQQVANSKADGYTLLVTASNHVINPLVLRTVPYDIFKDFTSVCYLGYVPQLVVVRQEFPASTFGEFLQMARDKPNTFTWATSGLGTAGHLAEELISQRAGLKMTVIGYRGGGPALTDVIAGHSTAMVEPVPSALPHVKSGRLKVLAVTSSKRARVLPDTPTVSESGLPGFELPSWYGVWGPAGLPPDVVRLLAAQIRTALGAEALRAKLDGISFEAVGADGTALDALMRSDSARYATVIKQAGIVVE